MQEGKTALHYAAAAGYAEVTEALIAAGADVNTTDHDSHTPMHAALLNHRGKVI